MIKECLESDFHNLDIHIEAIRRVQKSIKHPHFQYAIYNLDTGEVQYKWKKMKYWFSGKRIVYIEMEDNE